MNSIKNGIVLILILAMAPALRGQNENNQIEAPVNFLLGASYTIAPTLKVNGPWTGSNETSGSFYSAYADLIINNKFIGRAVVSSLIPSTLSNGLELAVESGFEMSGSMGYNYTLSSNQKINIPIMATIGFATVKTLSDRRDAGMQLGGTIGLNYDLTEKFILSGTARYLKGVDFSDGAKIDQVDVSLGIMIRLL